MPSNAAELERFLGMVAYFYRFINHASGKLAPLYKLKTTKNKNKFATKWTKIHDKAFNIAKEAIAKATMLVHPLKYSPTVLWCDASNIWNYIWSEIVRNISQKMLQLTKQVCGGG